ncbi:uncharacterized protein I303_105633 [Kwoniella dejecticola CBS 10117]|uniref:Serine protease n=1 Tax=Kwoniella dejecticola CBS 10117 TaxID=1296121 RepID=A0A1A6A1Y2_9TREE|nr:uncharacterized protein I303_04923 [Kwoniella dejecticola CBS 10117]OBR84067.1 hypothetical protein I303_04923 [Kwoniella dejecticola CBS 10117]
MLPCSSHCVGRLACYSKRRVTSAAYHAHARTYATASQLPLVQPVERELTNSTSHSDDTLSRRIHEFLSSQFTSTSLLSGSHRLNTGRTLPHVLPYESHPNAARRADSTQPSTDKIGDGLVAVVHAVQTDGGDIDYELSSGFIIEPHGLKDKQTVVTCSHTLDALSIRHPMTLIHSFILASNMDTTPIPITSYPSGSVSDLLICSIPRSPILRSLPISPFPVYRGQKVQVHEYGTGGEWIQGIKREWKEAEMMGYRNHAWREVQPGTTSALPYITFSSRPSNGSSGGPIVDAQSGAVVGVVSGSRTISAVKGERGYGASAENIFELFSLPGFIPTSQKYK